MRKEQMQRGVEAMMRWHSQREQDKKFLNSECEDAVEAILDELDSSEEQPDDAEAECDENKKEVVRLVKAVIKLKADVARTESERDELKRKVDILGSAFTCKDLAFEIMKKAHDEAAKERDELKANVKTLTDTVKKIVPERDELKLALEVNDAAVETIEEERDELKAKLDSIQQFVQGRVDFPFES